MEENKNINDESEDLGTPKKRTASDYEKLLSESQALRAAFLALSSSDPLAENNANENKAAQNGGATKNETVAGVPIEKSNDEKMAEEKPARKEKKSAKKGRSKKAKAEEKIVPETEEISAEENSVSVAEENPTADKIEPKAEPENPVANKRKNKKSKAEKTIEVKDEESKAVEVVESSEVIESTETTAEKNPRKKVSIMSWFKSNEPKRKSLWPVIAKRELKSYFSGPIAYIVTALFLALSGFMFFSTFFLANRAELRDFFQILPMLLSLFIPALTMRIFAEEKKSGSFETLLTLPVTVGDVVAGKYIASLISSLVMLIPSIFYVLACCIFGNPDPGPIIGGYVGAIFLAAAFTAIGMYCSSKTKNQILALIVSLALCLTLSMMHIFFMLLPGAFVPLISFLSATKHFDSISRGILDTRDLIYFASVTALFVVLTVRAVKKSMKG